MQSQLATSKSLSFPKASPTKFETLGSNGSDMSTAAANNQNGGGDTIDTWLGKARAWFDWYQGVLSGKVPLQAGEKAPTQTDLAQMQQWYQWALHSSPSGSNWDPSAPQGSIPGPAQGIPSGAKQGPMGNVVFNSEKAETTYNASTMPVDVLSDEFTLNVDVKVKGVSVEKTKDTRLNPATDMIKITVNDPTSVPSQTVYFVQPDAKIKINTVGGKGVTQNGTDTLKLPDGSAQVSIGSYQASATNSDGSTAAESSMPGVEDPLNPGTFTYKPDFETGDKIDFFSQPGKNQTHVVFANANITTKPGDTANATLAANGDLTIKVTHTDTPATSDTYVIKAGYNATLNINKEYISFDGNKSADGKVPASFGARLKVPTLEQAANAATTSPANAVNTGKGPEADAKVQAFISMFTSPKVTFDDVQKAGLVDEIVYGKEQPSPDMLHFILNHDQNLQYQKNQHNGAGQVSRVKTFLEGLGYKISTSLPAGYDKSAVIAPLLIVINGKPFHLINEGLGNTDPLSLNPYTRMEE